MADEDTLYVFISNNFRNKEIRWAVRNAARKGKTAISRALPENEIKWFDSYIKYDKLNNNFFGVPISNKQGQWMIIDILFSLIFERSSDENKKKFVDGMEKLDEWEKFLD